MKITSKDLLEHSFVISIDEHRYNQFKAVFENNGLLPIPQKFIGVTDKENTPQKNCYLSHRNVILKAKELNWPYVGVFEDDAYPVTNVLQELEYYLSDIPDGCACLLLGDTKTMKSRIFSDKFLNRISSCGAQSYILFQEYYDKYLQFFSYGNDADYCFIREKDDIIPKDRFYLTRKILFIQYNTMKSANGHIGYIYRKGGRDLTEEEIFKMGFAPIQ